MPGERITGRVLTFHYIASVAPPTKPLPLSSCNEICYLAPGVILFVILFEAGEFDRLRKRSVQLFYM